MFHVYLSPEHAGNSTATLVGWGVDDIERVVDELASKGVVFERYDEEPIITNEKGIATFERRQGRLFQGPRRQHPLDRSTTAFLSALRRYPECETAYLPECVEGRFCELRA
jgi:hypothetical protein